MKHVFNYVCIIIFFLSTCKLNAQNFCGADDIHNSRMQTDINYRNQLNDLELQIKHIIKNQSGNKMQSQVYNVPVVVHVIHLGEAIGTGTNISDAQITGAIQSLNNVFRNANGTGVDMQINFCLAVRDPNGNPTTGINRVNGTVVPNYATGGINNPYCNTVYADEQTVKNLSRWPFKDYLNIWVVNKICNGAYTGFATFQAGTTKDGACLIYSAMNANSVTLSHEVGHMFNLLHTFNGDGTNHNVCPADTSCGDNGDYVCDTPPHKQADIGATNPCTPNGIWNNSRYNIMSYSFVFSGNFNLTNMRFTQAQKDRARAVLLATSFHPYINSNGCMPASTNDAGIEAFTLPVKSCYSFNCNFPNALSPAVKIKNYGSSLLTTAIIKYKIDNGTLNTYQWNGALPYDSTETLQLPALQATAGAHTLLAYTLNPNGMADGYQQNDSADFYFEYIPSQTLSTATTSTDASCFGSNDASATVNAFSKVEIVEDFEAATDWNIVNGSEFNHWMIGSATSNGGNKSIYITDDNTSNHYNILITSVVHFYKDFYFPAGATDIKIKFDYRCNGQYSNYPGGVDRMKVHLVSTESFVEPIYQFGVSPFYNGIGSYFSQPTWKTDSIIGLDTIAGKAKRLVFTWRNNYDMGDQTPAAVDNLIVSYNLPATYNYAWNTNPVQTTATATGLTAGTYNVTISDNYGCSSSETVVINQPAQLFANITANGNTVFCSGDSVMLTSNAANSYLWSNGKTTQSIYAKTPGNYFVTITDANGCNAVSAATNVTVNSIPAKPGSITGPKNGVCINTTKTYSVPSVNNVTYNWTPPAGASITLGQGTNSVKIYFSNSFSGGDVSVTAGNICGTSPAQSITVKSVPSTPGIISGPVYSNCNVNSVFSIKKITGASTYTWNTNVAGAVITTFPSPGDTAVSISFPQFTSGTVSVTPNNTCGSGISKTITVYGTPSKPGSISGNALPCNGSIQNYYVAPVAGATSYKWTVPAGSIIQSGANTNSINVLMGNNGGNVAVKSKNACGLSAIRMLAVNVNCRMETDEKIQFSVYPNPAHDFVTVFFHMKANGKATVHLTDLSGRILETKTVEETTREISLNFDVQSYSSGIYMLQFISESYTKTVKVVIN